MSVDDLSGYKHLPRQYDVKRWQHRLFSEMRSGPMYRALLARLREVWKAGKHQGAPPDTFSEGFWFGSDLDPSSPYFHALEQAVKELRLTRNSRACVWAISYLHDDVVGRFDPDALPKMVSTANKRVVEISISPHLSSVDTYTGLGNHGYHAETVTGADGTEVTTYHSNIVRSSSAQHEHPMMVGEPEWQELECLAVKAARQAVADLKESSGEGAFLHSKDQITLGRERKKAEQIKRLAIRIAGRAGNRNHPKMDKRWCADLGIDIPAQR